MATQLNFITDSTAEVNCVGDLTPCAVREDAPPVQRPVGFQPSKSAAAEFLQMEMPEPPIEERHKPARVEKKIKSTKKVDKQPTAKSRSYIKSGGQLRFSPSVLAELNKIFDEYQIVDERDQVYFAHVAHGRMSGKYEGGVPIPWETTRKQYGSNEPDKALLLKGVIERVLYEYGYYRHQSGTGRCTEYRITSHLELRLARARAASIQKAETEVVNLFGKKVPTRRRTKKDEFGVAHDSLTQRAIDSNKRCIIDKWGVDALFEIYAKHEGMMSVDCREWRKVQHDRHCYEQIQRSNFQEIPGTGGRYWTYEPSWLMTFGGRISELGGGIQSCSRWMKWAALESIPNGRNYDMVAAHISLLRQELERVGLSTDWIEQYLRLGKEHYAGYAEISTDAWKVCLFAILFGGSLPTGNQIDCPVIKKNDCKVVINELNFAVWDEFNRRGVADVYHPQAIARVLELLQPLEDVLKQLHKILVKEAQANAKPGRNGELWYCNEFGVRFNLNDRKNMVKERLNKDLLGRRLTAHRLQSMESHYMKHVWASADESGFAVNSMMHDGCHVIGEIPTEAIERTRQVTGFKYIELKVKPIADENDPVIKMLKSKIANLPETPKPTQETLTKAVTAETPEWQIYTPPTPNHPLPPSTPHLHTPPPHTQPTTTPKHHQHTTYPLVLISTSTTLLSNPDTADNTEPAPLPKCQDETSGDSTNVLLKNQVQSYISDRDSVLVQEVSQSVGASDKSVAKILSQLGWKRIQRSIDGRRKWIYIPTETSQTQPESPVAPVVKSNVVELTPLAPAAPEPKPAATQPVKQSKPKLKLGMEVPYRNRVWVISEFRQGGLVKLTKGESDWALVPHEQVRAILFPQIQPEVQNFVIPKVKGKIDFFAPARLQSR